MPKTRNQVPVEMEKRMEMLEKGNDSIKAKLEDWRPLMVKTSQMKTAEQIQAHPYHKHNKKSTKEQGKHNKVNVVIGLHATNPQKFLPEAYC